MNEKTINTHRLMRIAAIYSVVTAFILIAIKFYAWFMTDSVSVLSSLIDSISDITISAINLFAINYALTPPDDDHRFGHNSAEDIAALFQSAFIFGSYLFITLSAINKFYNPTEIDSSNIGMIVMLISIVLTISLVSFQKYVVSKTGSTAIEADSMHYLGDIVANLAVILALYASTNLGWKYADPIFAICISIYMFIGSYKIGKIALDKLMDKEMPEKEIKKLHDIITNHEGSMGYHNLKTRYSGVKAFIQLHLDLQHNLSLLDAHTITDKLEHKIRAEFPESEVIIHQDPFDEASGEHIDH